MNITYKIVFDGSPVIYQKYNDYMIRTISHGPQWIKYVGNSADDGECVFETQGLVTRELLGAVIYDDYANRYRIVRVEAVGASGVSGMMGAQMLDMKHQFRRLLKEKTRVWDSVSVGGIKLAWPTVKDRLIAGWWKIALSVLLTWSLLYAITGFHFGLPLSLLVSVFYTATKPELVEHIKSIKNKAND